MDNDIISPQLQSYLPQEVISFVSNIFSKQKITKQDICDLSKNLVKQVHDNTEQQDKPKSWWQSVKSAFNRGKTEGKGGIKGFFKGCWEATKTGWRNTNKYAKMAIGAGCLLAGPLLMPLLSVTSSGTSATSATLQSASQFSSLSYNFSYIGYLFAHHTDTLASSLIAPVLSLATGVGSLISGGVEVARDIVNYVSPDKCFNVAQSRWHDIIAYAKYEHKQKCISSQTININSKEFIISELNAVIKAIKTEYKYFYNSNYPNDPDEDLQVVLNEYLKSLKERASKSQDNCAAVCPKLSTGNNIQKNNIDIQIRQEKNSINNKNKKDNGNIYKDTVEKLNRNLLNENKDNEENNINGAQNYQNYKYNDVNNDQIDGYNLENEKNTQNKTI